MCTGVWWYVQVCDDVYRCENMYRCVMMCTGVWEHVQVFDDVNRCVIICTGVWWCVQVFTIEQLSHLLVQDFWSFFNDPFSYQGSTGSNHFYSNRAGWRGLSLQQVMVDHLLHCPLQVAVWTAGQIETDKTTWLAYILFIISRQVGVTAWAQWLPLSLCGHLSSAGLPKLNIQRSRMGTIGD